MVDIADKAVTRRIAVARGRVCMQQKTLARVLGGRAPMGDVLAAARIAYVALLRSSDRRHFQRELCALRDFIAKATGREAEDVQNEFEDIASEAAS